MTVRLIVIWVYVVWWTVVASLIQNAKNRVCWGRKENRGPVKLSFYGCNKFCSITSKGLCYCQSIFKSFYKHTSLLSYRIKFHEPGLRSHFHNSSISLELTNGANKLECYITLDRKGLPWTNTLTYRVRSQVVKKMICEYGPGPLWSQSTLSFTAKKVFKWYTHLACTLSEIVRSSGPYTKKLFTLVIYRFS